MSDLLDKLQDWHWRLCGKHMGGILAHFPDGCAVVEDDMVQIVNEMEAELRAHNRSTEGDPT